MAVFKSILGEIRGSIAGTTYSRNGNSAYIRNKAIPVNPRSPGQTVSRTAMGYVAALWRSLTEAQRTAWKALAQTVPYTNAVGDSSFYSGFQLFMKLNRVLYPNVGDAVLNAPAGAPTFPGFSFGALQAEQDAVTFTDFTLTAALALVGLGTGFITQYQATGIISAGRTFVNESEYRAIDSDNPSATITTKILTPGYASVYGFPTISVVGGAIFVRARLIDAASGFTSPWQELKTIVVEA